MAHYSIILQDWDYTQEQTIKEFYSKGQYTPTQVKEVVGHCGSLYPHITTQEKAIEFVKDLKAKYPFVVFALMVGKTWEEMELIESF